MGVPKFVSKFLRPFRQGQYLPRYPETFLNQLPDSPTSWLIDFNGIIYEVAADFFLLNVDEDKLSKIEFRELERKRKSLLQQKETNPDAIENEFLNLIIERWNKIVEDVDPTHVIYLAVDGSVPQAKMY